VYYLTNTLKNVCGTFGCPSYGVSKEKPRVYDGLEKQIFGRYGFAFGILDIHKYLNSKYNLKVIVRNIQFPPRTP
jgi:hypothetical protein